MNENYKRPIDVIAEKGYTEFLEYLYKRAAFNMLSVNGDIILSLVKAPYIARKHGHIETASYLKTINLKILTEVGLVVYSAFMIAGCKASF